jgi:uncharacterized protein (DUF697 family)
MGEPGALPVAWLLGKTGAGKTSVVAALTGAARDDVGEGYAPATRKARLYAFPPEAPSLGFLDTRGLDDPAGDDAGEIAYAERRAALVLAVVRADDLALSAVLTPLRAARARRPDLPAIVAQTRLHDLYPPGARHPDPYPFDGGAGDLDRAGAPPALGRALLAQRRLFAGLKGAPPRFVPLDFTQPSQGLPPADYGAQTLWRALADAAPAMASALAPDPSRGLREKVIFPFAAAAAAAEATPVPVLGGLGAASLQAAMLRAIARRYGLDAGPGLWAEFAAAMGAGFALRYAGRFVVRQAAKFAPVLGGAAAAAWSFTTTWGLGEAGLAFVRARAKGVTADPAALSAAYAEGVARARDAWRRT